MANTRQFVNNTYTGANNEETHVENKIWIIHQLKNENLLNIRHMQLHTQQQQ